MIDVLFFAYIAYLLLQLLFYPVDTYCILTIAGLVAAYFLFRHIPMRFITILLFLLPIMVVVQIIYGYNSFEYPWQTLSDNMGTFNNTGIFGGFVAMGFVSAFGLLFLFKQPAVRIVLGILLIPITIQLIYSHSRAAWIAAIVGTLILLIPVFRKLTKWKVGILIPALLFAGVLFSIKLYHFKKDSADGRLLIWTVSWKMIKEKPLTGFGTGGFQKNYLLRQGDYFKNHPDSPYTDLADDISYPFNEFLKTGIEQGFIGLLLMIGILLLAFSNTASPLALRAILAALIGFSCFSYPFDIVAFQVLGVFCLAGIARQSVVFTAWRNPLKNGTVKIIVIYLMIVLCVFVSFISINYFVNVRKWNQIFRSYQMGNNQQITEFQSLYPAFRYNDMFVYVYGKALFDSGRYFEAVPLLKAAKEMFPLTQVLLLLGDAYEKTGDYFKALEEWETVSYIKPSLFTPHYKMAKLFFKLQNYEQAQQQAREVLSKKIKIDNPEIDQMKREARKMLSEPRLSEP